MRTFGSIIAALLDVDNLRLDGNTVSSTDTNGNIVLDPNGSGVIDAQSQVNVTGAVRSTVGLLLEETGAGTDTITIQAPSSIASSYTLTLPVDDGASNQVLSTNGSGVLSWANAATVPATAGGVYSDGSALASIAFSGNSDKVFGVNNGATSMEAKSIAAGTSGSDFAVAHSAGAITLNLPDAGASARGAVTTGAQTLAGLKTFSSGIVLPASGGTPATLDFFETGTFTANFNVGMNTNTNNVTVTFQRIGKEVILQFPQTLVTTNATSNEWSVASGTIPTRLRPYANCYNGVAVFNNNVIESGTIFAGTAGQLVLNRSGGANWSSATANSGIGGFSLAYLVS